jgi:tetratricopeptide (TPR) repeat protein
MKGPKRTRRRFRHAPILVAVGLAVVSLAPSCRRKEAGGEGPAASTAPVDPGQALYNSGKYAEALPLLEQSAAQGRTGTLLYEIGYAKGAVDGAHGTEKKRLWAEAEPLLAQEITSPGGATLDRYYYLTVINFDQAEPDKVQEYAHQAINQIEQGPNAGKLGGEDWFRLGRLHEFLEERSESEAAYRRAVSAFRDRPAANPGYQALALAAVAARDLEARRFSEAAAGYDQALALAPTLGHVPPYLHGIALLGAGRFNDAATAFMRDRDAETATDAQYGADLARKAQEAGGLDPQDHDGMAIEGMGGDLLDGRIREAAKSFRELRTKNSWKPGDALPAELIPAQKRLCALLREKFLQEHLLQEFCLREGIADLLRR